MSKLNELFAKELHVVNFGIESFYQDLVSQKQPAVHVDWKPVAGGDKVAAANLRKLKNPELAAKIEAANKEALRRILAAQPTLVGLGIAGEVIPGMTKKTILHAGPPVTWERMSGPQKGAVMGGLIYEGTGQGSEGGGGAGRFGRDQVRSVPYAQRRRPDGRCRDRVHAGLDHGEQDLWQPRVLHDQRGPGQGAALWCVRRRGAHAPALDGEGALSGAQGGGGVQGRDRRQGAHRQAVADGRRGAQPQRGRHVPCSSASWCPASWRPTSPRSRKPRPTTSSTATTTPS